MMDVDTTVSYEYDYNPKDGRVVIENYSVSTKKIEIVINNNSFFYDKEFHTFTPACNCSAGTESECLCTHLTIDYW